MRVALTMLLALAVGCGAKTALDVPPPAPCELDASLERVPFVCTDYELGPPIALTDEPGPAAFDAPLVGIDALDVVTSPEGAWLVFQYRDDRIHAVQMRTLSIDPEGRALGDARTFLSRRSRYARSLVEPTAVVWGCGRAALGGLMSATSDGTESESGCGLSIETRTASRTLTVAADELCSDLQLDGDTFSWLRVELTTSPLGIRLERAALDGSDRTTERTELPMLYRRVPLEDGTVVAAERVSTSDVPGAELAHFTSMGEPLGTEPLTDRFLRRFASAIDEERARWIVWSESDARDSETQDVFFARVSEDGSLSPRVPLDTAGLIPLYDETRPVWLGHRLVVPLGDDDNALSLGVLDEEGTLVMALPVADDAPDADLVLVAGGAVLLYADSRFDIDDRGLRVYRGSVLTSRTLRCAP